MAESPQDRVGGSGNESPEPMTDDDLLTLIGRYEKNSIGSEVAAGATVGDVFYDSTSQLTTAEVDRYEAMNAYWARPIGNEIENSSQVVLPELRDTVEWMMPQLARIFLAAQTPCVFEPEGPDDVHQAQVETAAVNHVFMHMNDGFNVIHDYMKDAMLMRNGYIRVAAEDEEQTKEEQYTGLDEMGLSQLLAGYDKQPEVVGQNEETVLVPPPLDAPPGTPPQKQTLFSVKLRISETVKRIIVEALPPEEVRIAASTRSNDLDRCPFVEHKTKKTRSQLISEGFDEATVNSLAAIPDDWFEMDALARNVLVDQLSNDSDVADFSMQEIPVRAVTIICDYDGDGVSERRQVLAAGNKILSNEVIEECPIASGVPKRMPHRHTGISLYDEIVHIQVIKSEILRQALNSLRLSTNPRIGVDWKNCNISDLLTWRAGGVVRTNGSPGNVLFPFTTPTDLMGQTLPMLEYADKWRAMSTGVGEHTMGVDADALQDVTKGAQLAAMSAASLKIEMVARLLAEGLKDAFLKVHSLLIRHQDVPLKFQIGEQWVETNPSHWKKRTRVRPNVGLGSGNREEARANMAMLVQIQERAAQLGLVGPKQGYNSAKQSIALLGYEHPEQYVLDPDSPEYKQLAAQRQQTPPAPQVIAAQERTKQVQIQAQADLAKSKAEIQAENTRAQAEVAHAAIQGREDRQVDMASLDGNMALKTLETLGKLLAPIIAAQYKQDPNANAGQVMRQDIQSLEGR